MSSLSASAASSTVLLHAFLLLLAATAMVASAAASEHRDVNMTTFTNAGASVEDDTEMYYCFLCTGRHPVLIHMCPIYWDTCFLNCWDADAAIDPATPSSSSVRSMDTVREDDECYVMKLYMSGRYVIVQRMSCDSVGPCFLTCGGGEVVHDQKAVTTAVPATIHQLAGRFVPSTEQLCNTEAAVNALRAPPSSPAAVVVPAAAAGAH